MRRTVLVLLAIFTAYGAVPAQHYSLTNYAFLPSAAGGKNVIQPGSIAMDDWRGNCYIASASLPHIAVVNIPGNRYDSAIAVPGNGILPVELLAVNPALRIVYYSNVPALPEHITLRSYDLLRGANGSWFNLGPCKRLHLIPDTKRNLVYVSTGREHILRLHASTLQLIDSIEVGVPAGGMAFDSANGELHVAQAQSQSGLSTVTRLSVVNGEKLRTITFHAAGSVDRVAYDAYLMRTIAFSDDRVWLFNEFGTMEFDYPVQGGIGAYAQSGMYNRLYFSIRRRSVHSPGTPVTGTLVQFGFDQHYVDSTGIYMGPLLLGVHEQSRSFAAVDCITSTLYVSRLPDMFPIAAIKLGASVQSLAALESGENILAANTFGAERELLVCTPPASRQRMETGMLPAAIAPLKSSNQYAVLSHDESTLYIHSANGDIQSALDIPLPAGGRFDVFPSITSDPEGKKVLCVSPQSGIFAIAGIESGALLHTGYIHEYGGTIYKGYGRIQPLFPGDGNIFLLLLLDNHELQVYGTDAGEYLYSIDLSRLDWQAVSPFERSCLRPGRNAGEVFIGPYVVPLDTAKTPNALLPPHSLLAGADSSELWVLRATGDSLRLMSLSSDGGTLLRETFLKELPGIPDGMLFSMKDKRAVFGCNSNATVYDYRFETPSSVHSMPIGEDAGLTVYPSPYRLSAGSNVTLKLNSPASGECTILIADLLGKVAEVQTRSINGSVSIGGGVFRQPGCYILRIAEDDCLRSALIMVVN